MITTEQWTTGPGFANLFTTSRPDPLEWLCLTLGGKWYEHIGVRSWRETVRHWLRFS